MFGIFESLVKATVSVVTIPVAVVADVVTLPASAYNGSDAFERTGGACGDLLDNLKDATRPSGK